MAIIYPQRVKTKWTNNYKQYYVEKGYNFTKAHDEFYVDIQDLKVSSNAKILVECDICGEKYYLSYKGAKASNQHFCSKDCSSKRSKHSEQFLISEYWRFVNVHGRHPDRKEMQVQNEYPSYYYYLKTWGSWTDFQISIGVLDEDGWLIEEKNILLEHYEHSPKEVMMELLPKFTSWESIKNKSRKLGLVRKYRPESVRKIPKEFLISEFWRFYNTNGRYPFATELKARDGYPSLMPYISTWGSWADFLSSLGILGTNNWYTYDEQVIRDKYSFYPKAEIMNSLMVKRTWETIVKKANQLGVVRSYEAKFNHRIMTKEFLINSLMSFQEKYGKTPTNEDFDKSQDYPSPKVFQKRFGSWNKALEEAGLEINCQMKHDKKMVISEAKAYFEKHNKSPLYSDLRFSQKLIRNYWGSWSELLIECELPIHVETCILNTREEGIDFLKKLQSDLKRVPSSLEVDKIEGINKSWFSYKFGSWTNALLESGLISEENIATREEMIHNSITLLQDMSDQLLRCPTVNEYDDAVKRNPNKAYTRRALCEVMDMTFMELCDEFLDYEYIKSNGFGYLCVNNEGKRCRSVDEVSISNLLLMNGMTLKYEPSYKDVIYTEECRYRFDWMIELTEDDIFVEYFGLFNTDNERFIEYVEKTYRKIELCKQNNLILISLFPEDLKNEYQGLKRKFSEKGIFISTPYLTSSAS